MMVQAPADRVASALRSPEAGRKKKERRYLTVAFHKRMMAELADLLGIEIDALPPVFQPQKPKALKIGISKDILARHPAVNPKALGYWFVRWVGTPQYLLRIENGLNRHDLEGEDCGQISDDDRLQAKDRLAKRLKRLKAQKNGDRNAPAHNLRLLEP